MTTTRAVRVDELFEPTNGKPKYIKSYVDANPGPYPVHSASVTQPFGLIDTWDFEGEYLTWVMNGYGGRVQCMSGRFSANRDRGVLVPREGVRIPSLTYLRFALEPVFVDHAVGRRVDGHLNEYTKLYPPTVAGIEVDLPVVAGSDALDYELMEEVGAKLSRIEDVKLRTASIAQEIEDADVIFDVDGPTETISLASDSFRLSIGRRQLLSSVGPVGGDGVPVYSANVRVPFGVLPEPSGMSYEHASLIWGIDGTFDWNLIPVGQPFIPTDHCGRVEVLDDRLDPEYLLYALRSTKAAYGFDRIFRANLANVSDLVGVVVPLDTAGDPCLERQRSIARSYASLLQLRDSSIDAVREVLNVRLGLQLGAVGT